MIADRKGESWIKLGCVGMSRRKCFGILVEGRGWGLGGKVRTGHIPDRLDRGHSSRGKPKNKRGELIAPLGRNVGLLDLFFFWLLSFALWCVFVSHGSKHDTVGRPRVSTKLILGSAGTVAGM